MSAAAWQAWWASGALLDAVLLLVAGEACALAWWTRRRGTGPALADLWPMLAAGALLMLALRAVLAGASWPVPAALLAAAGVAHAIDLARRWRRAALRPS